MKKGSSRVRRSLIQGLAVVTVLLLLFAGAAHTAKKGNEGSPADKKAIPVEVLTLSPQDLPVVIESVGRLYADRKVVISAEVPGIIKKYMADRGDEVASGALLVQIQPIDYRLALEEAESNLAAADVHLSVAEKAFARFRKLLPQQVISQDNFDKVEAEFKAARAQRDQAATGVKIARERLEKTRITAPFDGLVAERTVEIGQMVNTGTPLITLLDLNRVRVKIYLAEKDFVHVDRRDPVEVSVVAFPDRSFGGSVGRIDIESDPMTNTFGVEILIDNRNHLLKAGLTARTRMTTQIHRDTLLIPQSALLFREKGPEVFAVDGNGIADERSVILGQTHGDRIRVLDGLSPGDRLVIKGQNYLRRGDRVQITTEQHQSGS